MTENETLSEDSYMTPAQVCELLQIDKSWLYDQVQMGRIPHAKFGRQLRFHRGLLLAWARDQWK